MKEIYYDPANVAGFTTAHKLYMEAKQRGVKVTLSEVRDWLKGQETYTLHKPRRLKFKRRRTFVAGINDLYQADLADMSNLSAHNDGIKYLLVIIDCFTKFARVLPVKNKKAESILTALKTIFDKVQPKIFQTDNGKEFVNSLVYNYCKSKGINIYTARNKETKASIAERFIRTLKGKIFKYLTAKNSKKYIDVLPDLVETYNKTKNRYGFRPVDVTAENENEIRAKLFPQVDIDVVYKYQLGDIVRISKERLPFERGFNQLWSLEVFTIDKQLPFDPPVYEVVDANGELILGRFYTQELQHVYILDDTYKIEKILGKRKGKQGTEYLVKWLGYPKSMNSWVHERDMRPI